MSKAAEACLAGPDQNVTACLEARLAELEGTVVLSGVIDPVGVAQNLQLVESGRVWAG